jgi:addiction module HigA family antidote
MISGGFVLSGWLMAPMTSRSRIITEGDRIMMKMKNGMRPVHPGEILLEEFMQPSDPPLNANMLAKALAVPANRITAIIKGQRGITGDTAVRLATFFNTTAEFWMNLQKTYELRLAEEALPVKVRRHIEQRRGALVTA